MDKNKRKKVELCFFSSFIHVKTIQIALKKLNVEKTIFYFYFLSAVFKIYQTYQAIKGFLLKKECDPQHERWGLKRDFPMNMTCQAPIKSPVGQ